jgi:hypothetical protein
LGCVEDYTQPLDVAIDFYSEIDTPEEKAAKEKEKGQPKK